MIPVDHIFDSYLLIILINIKIHIYIKYRLNSMSCKELRLDQRYQPLPIIIITQYHKPARPMRKNCRLHSRRPPTIS